jgi:N-acetylglucosamine-6-sulfatase
MIRNRTGEHELYDLLRDPLQMKNVNRQPAYRGAERSMLKVWWRTRNCAGSTCRAELPEKLRADPGAAARMTRSYWRSVREVYGF